MLPWRGPLGYTAEGAALLLLLSKAYHIPATWIHRPFGQWLGAEADFVGSFFLTFGAAFLAAILLSVGRLVLKRWGKLTLPCIAVLLAHLIQDFVLAWEAYSQ